MSRITWIALGFAALRAAAASQVAEAHAAVITPSPVLHRRDFSPDFFGYVLGEDEITSGYTCLSPFTYSSSSQYVGCAGDGIYLAVDCDGAYIKYEDSSVVSCINYCVTNMVYFSTDDFSPSYNIDCSTSPIGIEILRSSIEDTATVGQITIEVTVTPSTTPSSVPTSTSASTSTSTTSVVPLPTTSPKKNNAPIIGGAVGGALVLIGLIGLGLFIFFRKRSQSSQSTNPGGFGNQNNQPALVSPTPYSPQPQGPAMSQAYASPVGSPPMSPYQPAPYSPPPVYGQEKSAAYAVTTSPVQQAEYRLPDGTAEVHGISSPVQPNQGPRAGANELA